MAHSGVLTGRVTQSHTGSHSELNGVVVRELFAHDDHNLDPDC